MSYRVNLRRYHSDKFYRLGYDLHERGEHKEAIEALEVSAELGSTDAMAFLGAIYDDALVPPKEGAARYWLKRGADAGNPECAWNLAMHYSQRGNRRRYEHWLNVSEKIGCEDALQEKASMYWWNKHNPLK